MQSVITGGATLAIAIFFYGATYLIHDPGYDPLGPRFLPRLTLVPIGLIAVWILFRGILELRAQGSTQEVGQGSHGEEHDGGNGADCRPTVGY
ncbi:MAG: hypothetical protein AAFY56_09550, partial [Pseudomonadota bacterium]